uniref:HGWP repeat containing protein-like n=1 Tax=Oryza sativa subsp. japonica TaxID=39947 RepID=Q6UU59_ORYSJ|nr:hypothetical protein OSJNBa0079E14.5 [Oryza sativa Japonica Group]
MAAGSSAPVSPSSGRPLPLPTLYKPSPCLPPPFPPLAALSPRRNRARAIALSLRRRRRAPVRRRRRPGPSPASASPSSGSPQPRRPRPPLRFGRRPPERRRPRRPEPRRRLYPLRSPFPSSPSTRGEPWIADSFPPSLPSLGHRSAAPVVAGGDHRGTSAPPPVGCAGVAAFGRAPRLPRGARPSAARALGCG